MHNGTGGTTLGINGSADDFVAWAWKFGNEAVTNDDGTGTTIVNAAPEAGMSAIVYTGNSTGQTLGHGLNQTPQLVIVKNRIGASNWSVNGSVAGLIYGTNKLVFQGVAGIVSDTNEVIGANDTIINVGTSGATNNNGQSHIAWCFHSAEGFSRIGTYLGNGDAVGEFVYTGFRPAFIMTKNVSASGSDWNIYDVARNKINPSNITSAINTSVVEETARNIDILSNGFKLRVGGGSNPNVLDEDYLYVAFAEAPFKYSNGK
jgi:hypothetical protein